MKTSLPLLGPAFEWCDRRCQRCPLATRCVLLRRLRQIAFLHDAAAEDLHGWEPVLGELWSSLDRGLERAGLGFPDPHAHLAPPSRRRPHIDRELRARIVDPWDRYYVAALELCAEPAAATSFVVAENTTRAIFITERILRIAALLSAAKRKRKPIVDSRLAGNLMLVAELEKAHWGAVMELGRSRGADTRDFERARTELRLVLDPLLDEIPRAVHRAVARLREQGAAPSPFVRQRPLIPRSDGFEL